jgi:hypothetical protein
VEPEDDRARGQDGAGVAGRDEGVGPAGLLQAEADDNGGVALAPDRLERLVGHRDHLGGGHDPQPGAVGVRVPGELGLDRVGAADEQQLAPRRQPGQRPDRARDFRRRRVVAAHRVERDPDHAQRSSTSIRFCPR